MWIETDQECGQAAAAACVMDGHLATMFAGELRDDSGEDDNLPLPDPEPAIALSPVLPVGKIVPPDDQIDAAIT